MREVRRMTELHPGLILILTGIVACAVPRTLRKILLVLGPIGALAAALSMNLGTDLTFNFVKDHVFHFYHVDELSYVFCMVFALMAVIGGVYSCHNENRMEALCSMSYAGGALGVALAGDWVTFIFFWELLAVTSVFLVWLNRTPASRRAAFRYILVHMLGGNFLLLGIFLQLSQGQALVGNIVGGPHDASFWCIMFGIGLNAAIPPVHAWLVDAYPESTLTGGIFMSSFTTKVAVYGLIRVLAGDQLFMWLGAVMAIYGACYAVMENDMRKLLSYHIISQVGFMVAGAGIGTNLALDGATAHAFSDILFKSLLFMCVSTITYATGIRHINQLGAMAKRMPFVAVCFFIGAFSISGVPLFNGFVSKTITIAAAAEAGHHAIYELLELASVGTFLSITLKMGYFIFLRKYEEVKFIAQVPKNMYAGMGLGAFFCTLYGVMPDLLYRYLPFPGMTYQPFEPEHIISCVQMFAAAAIPFIMFLPRMEPHTALSLDTDWFYRKPFAFIIYRLSALCCALSTALSMAWGTGVAKVMKLTENPMEFLDAKPFRKRSRFYARNYRTAIADPTMIILTVLISMIGVLLTCLK